MRVDFTKAVTQLLEADAQGVFLTGDVGYNALEGLQASLGARFLNAGVAEQNMVGVAAGLALGGWRPWVYSIAPFVTYRCLEQIRNDACLHHLPVRVVGNGGGYTYGVMGSTHHALEDLGCLKPLPGIELFFPCANDHVAAAVALMGPLSGPAYLRLAISPHTTNRAPLSENARTLTRHYHEGDRVTLIGVGHAVQTFLAALALPEAAALQGRCDVFGIARFPFDLQADHALVESCRRTGRVLVVEEHYQAGGMGESLAAVLPRGGTFEILAARYQKGQRYGSPAFHMKQSGLGPQQVLARIQETVA